MSMHKGMLGRIGEPGPGSADLTLGDYIARKQRQDAFDQVAQENKLSFDEWFRRVNAVYGLPPAYDLAKMTWYASKDNA